MVNDVTMVDRTQRNLKLPPTIDAAAERYLEHVHAGGMTDCTVQTLCAAGILALLDLPDVDRLEWIRRAQTPVVSEAIRRLREQEAEPTGAKRVRDASEAAQTTKPPRGVPEGPREKRSRKGA